MPFFSKAVLFLAGAISVGIGAAVLIIPEAFFAYNGIVLHQDPSLLSEVRAPGGTLLVLGVFMLAGVFRSGLATAARNIAAAVFLSYGFARILSVAVDGTPDEKLVIAAVFEIGIGLLCILPVPLRRKVEPSAAAALAPR
ncbi:DUF4345 domain-containing protein [Neptunicoccus cionae]|uniref:DUF4345 domain-containing protein n=1 Tax=Neptunicoccus cionae TaxID=2035344 RepID=UPI000C770C2B|nr:DUF4345 domain-containing protein [Amylibacter cionae]PLS21091.1 DUF4345 domain-containing protein [Amylibacter cionae]